MRNADHGGEDFVAPTELFFGYIHKMFKKPKLLIA